MTNARWRKQILIAALGLTITACADQKPQEKGWQQFLDDGKFLDIQEKREEARTNYKTALTKLRGEKFELDWRAEIIARLARLDVLEGKLDQADQRANQAIKLALDPKAQGPNHGEVLVVLDDLAESYAQRSYKSRDDKVRCLEMAIKIFDATLSKSQQRLRNRCTCDLTVELIITGNRDKAAPFEQAVVKQTMERRDWTGLRDLAAAYGFIKDQAKVDQYCAAANKLFTKKRSESIIKAAYIMQLSKLYRDNARLDDAEKVLVDYLDEIKPNQAHADAYELLATIYGAKNETEKAKQNWRIAILKDAERSKVKSNRSRFENYARYLRKINQMDEAKLMQQQADRLRDSADTL